MSDHNWPADLGEPDAACEWCGLEYGDWNTEDPGCPGPPEDAWIAKSSWQIDMAGHTVVVAHYDHGADWEHTMVFGPFDTTEEADKFAKEYEALYKAPDSTVLTEVTSLHNATHGAIPL